jgi:hypothetical protein
MALRGIYASYTPLWHSYYFLFNGSDSCKEEVTREYEMDIDIRQGHLAEEALQSTILQTVAYQLVTTAATLCHDQQ